MSDTRTRRARRRPQDLQALHRRRVPAVRVGTHLRDHRRERQVPRQRRARVAQGRARRGRRREGRASRSGRARPRTTAGRSSTASPRCSRGGERSSSTKCVEADEPAEAHRGEGRRRGDRPVGLVRRMERQDRAGARLVESRRRIVLRLLGARADRRRGGARAAGVVAARARLGRRARHRHAATPAWSSRRNGVRIPAISLTEVLATSDLPAGVVNMLTGSADELAPWLAAHMDVNAIDLCGAPPDSVTDLERAAADNLKRVVRRRDEQRARLVPRSRPRPDARVPRDQDRLASDRGLNQARA